MLDLRIDDRTPELFQKLEAAVSRFIQSAADNAAEVAKTSMREPKSGRTYGNHRASAPGESPASHSGRYLSGIEVIMQSSLEVKVGASAEYGMLLEYGMDRPLWQNTLTEILPTLEQRLASEISAI